MQRWISLLAVILVLQLALAAVLGTRRNPLAAATPSTPLLAATVKDADRVIIEAKPASGAAADSARVELVRQQGKWILPGYFNAPADGARLQLLLARLSGLKRGLPIATSPASLRRFKLVDDDFERRLQFDQGSKPLATLYVGSSPGLRKSDARTAQDHAVYAVDLATYELPTQSSDWFDGDLLRRDPASIVELDVTREPHDSFELLRQPAAAKDKSASQWSDPTLAAGKQLDVAHVDALVQAVAQLHAQGVLGTEMNPQWQQEHPQLTLTLKDAPGQTATWTLSKPSFGEDYVLKSSVYPWYLSIDAVNAKALLDDSAPAALLAGPAATHAAAAAPTAAAPATPAAAAPTSAAPATAAPAKSAPAGAGAAH
jgi:hypothetical protein